MEAHAPVKNRRPPCEIGTAFDGQTQWYPFRVRCSLRFGSAILLGLSICGLGLALLWTGGSSGPQRAPNAPRMLLRGNVTSVHSTWSFTFDQAPRAAPAIELVREPPPGYSFLGVISDSWGPHNLPARAAELGAEYFVVNEPGNDGESTVSLYALQGSQIDTRSTLAILAAHILLQAKWPIPCSPPPVIREDVREPLPAHYFARDR